MKARRKISSWFAGLLVVALITGILPFNSIAYAAETITNVEFESSLDPIKLVVDGQSQQLKLYATIKDESTKRDVTGLATWTSSNPSAVSVESGWIKGVGKGTSEITAKYQGFTLKKTVESSLMYEKITIKNASDEVVADELNLLMGTKPKWKAYATVNDSNKTTEDDITDEATWSSSNTSVAEVSKGVVTLKAKGTAELTVKYKGQSQTVKITVVMPYKELKIVPNKLLEFTYGDSEQVLTATVNNDGSIGTVTSSDLEWTSSDVNVVEVEDGKVKPVNVGSATITASYLGLSATVTVVVRSSFQAIKLTPNTKQTKMVGDSPLTLEANVLKSDGTESNINALAEWISSNPMAATVNNGVVSFRSEGTTTITVKYEGISKSIDVTVYPTITGGLDWKVKDESQKDGDIREVELYVDETKEIPMVVGKTYGGDSVDVGSLIEWESNNTSAVKIDDGKIKGLESGKAQLTGKLKGETIYLDVIVNRKALIMQASETELSLVTGREVKAPTVTVIFTDGEEKDITDEIEWEASSANLLVKNGTLKGLVASKLSLNGSYANVKLSVKVTIEDAVVSFDIDPEVVNLNIGKSSSIKVTGKYKNGKTVSLASKIEWKVENEKIATIKGTSVKGVALGSTKLVGEYQGTKLEIPVNVKPKLLKMEANPSSVTLAVGQSTSWSVSAIYDTGEVVDVTSQVTWVPSSTKIKVWRGTVAGAAKGSGTIKFSLDGKTASLRVTVK